MEEDMEILTTKADFEYFKKRCLFWIDYFGLKGWEYYFFHEQWNEKTFANVRINVIGRVVSLNLSKKWSNVRKTTKVELDKCAFHEVCEVLLGRLSYLAIERFIKDEEVDEEVHNIVRTLEKVVLEKRL